MRNTSPLRLGGLLLLLLLPACGREGGEVPARSLPPAGGDEFLVRVGDRKLGLDEFRSFVPEDYQGLLTAGERREFLDRWVDTELLYLGAVSRGLLEDPALQRRLVQQQRDFVAHAYLQAVLDERVAIGEEQIAAYFAAHGEEYSWEYRYRQIVVNSREEAGDIHRRLAAGELSFRRAAEKYSLDASARLGGDMGWMSRAAIPPEHLQRLAGMEEDAFSEPFETSWGWTLIQLRQRRRSENALELDEVRDEILRQLLVEERRRTYEEILRELRVAFPVEYHPETEERLRGDSQPATAP